MATLYITEYTDIGTSNNGQPVQIAMVPPTAQQTVAISGASTASAAFNARTKFVRLHTDAICSIAFGTAPTATTVQTRMPADSSEYFQIPVAQTYKVAVITNT